MGNRYQKRIVFTVFFLAALYALVWASVSRADQAAGGGGEKDYVIGVGDVLDVQVWQEPSLTRTVTVRLDGKISLPLAGDVQAAGETTSDLDQLLVKKFSAVVNEPSVSVILVENHSRQYYVVGQVAHPGEFPIQYPLTILQAIARSGGFLEWAKRGEIKVVRRQDGKEDLINFDYDALVNGRNPQQNILIMPGDTVIVP